MGRTLVRLIPKVIMSSYSFSKSTYNNLYSVYIDLHNELNALPQYKYIGNGVFSSIDGKLCPYTPPKIGGIYIMFDKGESFNGFDRIVRVGKAESSLLKRLTQHFIKPDKDHSIFRKHIGRALLTQQGIQTEKWDIKGFTIPQVEKQVTDYLIKNITFSVIPLTNKEDICKLEQTLLEILSIYNRLHKEITGKYIQSPDWLGNFCTNPKVRECGLWNDEHIRSWKHKTTPNGNANKP